MDSPTVDRPAWAHELCIFTSDDEFLATTVPVIEDALRAGNAAVAFTSAPHAAILTAALGPAAQRAVIGVADDVWNGAPRTFEAHRRAMARYTADSRTGAVDIVAEPSWMMQPTDATIRWHAYEAAANHLFADALGRTVCMYDADRVPARVLEEARRTHPALLVDGRSVPSPDFLDPLAYVGRVEAALLSDSPPATSRRITVRRGSDLHDARHDAAEAAGRAGIPPERIDDVLVAASELATNALLHGGGEATVTMWSERGTFFCQVDDSGGEFQPELPGFAPPPTGHRGGYGLWLARCLSDGMAVATEAGRTLVRVRFSADPSAVSAASLPAGA